MKLLPWLMNKFRSLGGTTRTRKINNLSELAEEGYGIVINCSGLGARELVGDLMVKPIRGQVTRVMNSSVFLNIIKQEPNI